MYCFFADVYLLNHKKNISIVKYWPESKGQQFIYNERIIYKLFFKNNKFSQFIYALNSLQIINIWFKSWSMGNAALGSRSQYGKSTFIAQNLLKKLK